MNEDTLSSKVFDDSDKRAIWSTFARALDAELRPGTTIRGQSGLDHQVQAVAVDDLRKRVIIVSAEPNSRIAAMMQVDIQATLTDSRVLVARPISVDLPEMLRRFVAPLGLDAIDIARAKAWFQSPDQEAKTQELAALGFEGAMEKSLAPFISPDIPAMSQILSFVGQAGELPWSDIMQIFNETAASGTLDLTALLATDSLAADLKAGVCPIPLYELGEDDLALFQSGSDLDAAKGRLRQLNILQYFYPSRDQLALGLIDEGLSAGAEIARVGEIAPSLGHPFGEAELIDPTADFVGTLAGLKEAGYVAEGELGVEISEKGRSVRSTIKVRPREGFLTKLLNRTSISVSPFDVFKP